MFPEESCIRMISLVRTVQITSKAYSHSTNIFSRCSNSLLWFPRKKCENRACFERVKIRRAPVGKALSRCPFPRLVVVVVVVIVVVATDSLKGARGWAAASLHNYVARKRSSSVGRGEIPGKWATGPPCNDRFQLSSFSREQPNAHKWIFAWESGERVAIAVARSKLFQPGNDGSFHARVFHCTRFDRLSEIENLTLLDTLADRRKLVSRENNPKKT